MHRPDRDIIGELFEQHAERVFSIGYQLTGNRELPKDIVQDTFLSVHRSIARFRGESSHATWIYRIAVNASRRAALSERRARAREREAAQRAAAAPGDPEHTERVAAFYSALAELPEDQREALALLSIRSIPASVISEILRVPVGTVYSRAHAARQKVAAKISGHPDKE